MRPLDSRTLEINGQRCYAQIYQSDNGRFYGMVWNDHDVNIMQTQEFDTGEDAWDRIRKALEAAIPPDR